VVHSREDEDVGAAHKVNSPKNHSQYSYITMEWIGINLATKQAFRLTQIFFQKFTTEFFNSEFFTD